MFGLTTRRRKLGTVYYFPFVEWRRAQGENSILSPISRGKAARALALLLALCAWLAAPPALAQAKSLQLLIERAGTPEGQIAAGELIFENFSAALGSRSVPIALDEILVEAIEGDPANPGIRFLGPSGSLLTIIDREIKALFVRYEARTRDGTPRIAGAALASQARNFTSEEIFFSASGIIIGLATTELAEHLDPGRTTLRLTSEKGFSERSSIKVSTSFILSSFEVSPVGFAQIRNVELTFTLLPRTALECQFAEIDRIVDRIQVCPFPDGREPGTLGDQVLPIAGGPIVTTDGTTNEVALFSYDGLNRTLRTAHELRGTLSEQPLTDNTTRLLRPEGDGRDSVLQEAEFDAAAGPPFIVVNNIFVALSGAVLRSLVLIFPNADTGEDVNVPICEEGDKVAVGGQTYTVEEIADPFPEDPDASITNDGTVVVNVKVRAPGGEVLTALLFKDVSGVLTGGGVVTDVLLEGDTLDTDVGFITLRSIEAVAVNKETGGIVLRDGPASGPPTRAAFYRLLPGQPATRVVGVGDRIPGGGEVEFLETTNVSINEGGTTNFTYEAEDEATDPSNFEFIRYAAVDTIEGEPTVFAQEGQDHECSGREVDRITGLAPGVIGMENSEHGTTVCRSGIDEVTGLPSFERLFGTGDLVTYGDGSTDTVMDILPIDPRAANQALAAFLVRFVGGDPVLGVPALLLFPLGPAAAPVEGDLDGDGVLGPGDVAAFTAVFGEVEGAPGSTYDPAADFNRNGRIDVNDYLRLRRLLSGAG